MERPRPNQTSPHNPWNERVGFFRSFLRDPLQVGALAPSSRRLALAMLSQCDFDRAKTVVELGPGTGAFTGPILDRLQPQALFFALELDREHCWSLNTRFPGLQVYNDSAENLGTHLHRHGRTQTDIIVSGLPWASLPANIQDRIFTNMLQHLHPQGSFSTFAYVHARWLPKATRFRNRLQLHFDRVHVSRVVWGNLPPACVYHCSGVRPHSVSR